MIATNVISVNTIKLLRIPFSFFLLPVFLFALTEARSISWSSTVYSFIIIHLLVYPSSNGYNSYVDQDESSIGGLEHPPKAGKEMLHLSLLLDLLALILAFLVNKWFFSGVLLYILASRLYSAPYPRLKKYPVGGFLLVVLFQGLVTFLFSLAGIEDGSPFYDLPGWAIPAAAFQIGGAYPLTQVYQHAEDQRQGVRSLSMKLGVKGTFYFSGLMFVLSAACYFLHYKAANTTKYFLILSLLFIPVLAYFISWLLKIRQHEGSADYRHTMNMNLLSSACMTLSFLTIFMLKHH